MKRLCLIAAVLFGCKYVAMAQSSTSGDLIQLESRFNDALVRADLKTIEEIEADDLIFTDATGTVTSKADEMQSLKSGDVKFESIKMDNTRVQDFGNLAVVTGRLVEKAQYKNADISGTYRFTDVLAKRKGKWEHIAGQETLVSTPAAPVSDTELRVVMAKRHQAMIDNDEAVVDRMTAKEYVQTDVLGHVQDKSAWMAEYFRPLAALIKAGKFRWERYDERDVRAVMLGDTAVVTGELVMKGTGAKFAQGKWEEAPGASIEGTLRFTRVWIKRDGLWVLAALHNSAPMGVQTSRP